MGRKKKSKLERVSIEPKFTPFDRQMEFLICPARFRTVIAGVRGGKTASGALELAYQALGTENGHFWCISPTYKMLDVAEREFKKLLDEAVEDTNVRLYEYAVKDRRYTLPSRSIVEFRSAEWPDTLRGPGLNGAWMDEAAYMKEEAARIVRTRVSDKLGRIWVTTTPRGKNWVHRWFNYGRSEDRKSYASFRWTSKDNPYFPDEEWAEAKADLPADFFAQEYEAKFLDDVAGVFRDIDKVISREAITEAEGPFTMGLDLAKSRDFTVFVVMDVQGRVVDFERMHELSWVIQKEEAVRLARKWNARIWMDSTGPGDPIHDELQEILGHENVVGVKFTVESKRRMIQALQSAIERKTVLLPDTEILADELRWFEYKRLPSGGIRYEAPRGFTDDCVFSLALANWGRLSAANVGSPVIIDREPDINRPDLGLAGSLPMRQPLWAGGTRRGIFRN